MDKDTEASPLHLGLEARIAAAIAPTLAHMGYEIVRIMVLGRDRPTVQVMADRADGALIAVEDCERISTVVSATLDVEDMIKTAWTLEVSSAGIDRPLTRPKDWNRFAGHEARAETNMPVGGRKRFTGTVLGADDTHGRIRLEDGAEVALPLADLRRAKLVLTDALIAATAQPLAQEPAVPPTRRTEEAAMDTAVARPELLLVADAVAREKSIDREEVIEAMEQAIQKAGRAKYGNEKDIRATIDRRTGDVRLSRWTEAVEVVENEETQIPFHIARKFKPDIEIGGHLVDPLPPIDFGRIAAQTAKQVIVQRVREYERKKQYDEFKDRVGEIINGLVKRTEYGNLMVELGRAEALLRRDELIPRESFRNGDRVRAYIYDVREEPRGPQIFLSRTHPAFLAKLFAQEVPEIYDGIIEIKAVSRDPGSRAKMAVISRDSSIDPVGACVGMRGSRVQAVVQELQGEKIDIIPWSSQAATFVVNALAPAEVTKVVMDEEAGRVEVVVPDEQLSLAIGRRGQNVRLASQLTRWDIDILTEAEESERRQEEYRRRTGIFVEALDVDDMIAGLLVTEGFTSVEELAFTPPDELADIEGFDENVAAELLSRAELFLQRRDVELDDRRMALGVSDEIAGIEQFTPAMLVQLGEKGIKTRDDLADLAGDELVEIFGTDAMEEETANAIIMVARAHWFEDGSVPAPEEAPAPEAAPDA